MVANGAVDAKRRFSWGFSGWWAGPFTSCRLSALVYNWLPSHLVSPGTLERNKPAVSNDSHDVDWWYVGTTGAMSGHAPGPKTMPLVQAPPFLGGLKPMPHGVVSLIQAIIASWLPCPS